MEHRGLDINAPDSDGWTPLHAALFFEQDKAAEILVMSGASLTQTTNMVLSYAELCQIKLFV